jgi:hypothetical protein
MVITSSLNILDYMSLHITALGNKIIHHNNAVLFQLSLKHLKTGNSLLNTANS